MNVFAFLNIKRKRDEYKALLEEVWKAIEGGPKHPWIPGSQFVNSDLYAKLESAVGQKAKDSK